MEFIDLQYQYQRYKNEIDNAIQEVIASGQFIMGEAIQKLEASLAEYTQVEHCIATSNGTDSLLLALSAINVGPEDEVICVPFTWVSPVEVVSRLGAKPVFVDIDPETYLIDVSQIEKAITKKTKAIIPVSLCGQMPDLKQIMKIAEAHDIAVIEDGAQSFGATQNGRRSCSMTTIGSTSFFPTKPLGCYGDGGAVFTNDSDLAEKIKALRIHGAPQRYHHKYIGMNARMDTLQAAILSAKFPFFEKELELRQTVSDYYNEGLKEAFSVPKVIKGNTHIYAQYALQSDNREEILDALKRQNIPYGIYYPKCIHEQPAYSYLGYKRGDFPNAEKVADRIFSIPMHPWLTIEEQDKIITTLKISILQIA